MPLWLTCFSKGFKNICQQQNISFQVCAVTTFQGFSLEGIPNLLCMFIILITDNFHVQLAVRSTLWLQICFSKFFQLCIYLIYSFSNYQPKFFIVAPMFSSITNILLSAIFDIAFQSFFVLQYLAHAFVRNITNTPLSYHHLCIYYIEFDLHSITYLLVYLDLM